MQCMQEMKNLTYSWLLGIKLPSVAEVQPSSHWCVVCCMLTLHDALMIWVTSGDSPAVGRCLTKLLLPEWADPRLGVVSLFLVAGAGVDVLVSTVVLSLVSPTAQTNCTNCENHRCVCQQGTITKAVAQSCASLQHSSSNTEWGENIGIKV